jgi:putative PIN family toxin of toxin-antitoxin system
VPDVNVLFRAAVNRAGASGLVLHAAWNGRIKLVGSWPLLEELRSTLAKPHLRERFDIGDDEANDAMAELALVAEVLDVVPAVFDLPRDPKDAYLVDLAVAARASVITSTDNDLLDLMGDNPDGHDFRRRFPEIEVLTPPELLGRLRQEEITA